MGFWYRFTFTHGRGHPTTDVEYVWEEESLSEADLEEMWQDRARGMHYESITGDHVLVEKLPDDVRRAKIQAYLNKIEHARFMLGVLGHTEAAK